MKNYGKQLHLIIFTGKNDFFKEWKIKMNKFIKFK